jgi:hypothetical protein
VRYCGRSLPGRAWAFCLVAAMSATLVGPAYAQGPEPAPTGAKPKPVGPEPAPTSRSKASSSESTKQPAATAPPPAVRTVVAPPAAIAPQSPVQRAPAPQPRVKAPKRRAAARTQRARGPAKEPVAKVTLGAGHRPGTSVDAAPDGKLLAGGLALFVLLLGETIFLALSVRFLAVSRRV